MYYQNKQPIIISTLKLMIKIITKVMSIGGLQVKFVHKDLKIYQWVFKPKKKTSSEFKSLKPISHVLKS